MFIRLRLQGSCQGLRRIAPRENYTKVLWGKSKTFWSAILVYHMVDINKNRLSLETQEGFWKLLLIKKW